MLTPKDSLDIVLDTVASAMKPLVASIEATPATTKDHYGDYMSAIARVAGMIGQAQDKKILLAIGVALQRAGANKNGVTSALRVMGAI